LKFAELTNINSFFLKKPT